MSASILIVDDSTSIRVAIRMALTGAGYTVSEAADGAQGLSKASGSRFDMIITDLNMPNMDGLSMIRALRKNPAQCGTPILFLTTESEDAMKQQPRPPARPAGWSSRSSPTS